MINRLKPLSIDTFLTCTLAIFALIPVLFHQHLIKKDFLELMGIADGIFQGMGYCFIKLDHYLGIAKITGLSSRPPLIPLLLTGSFHLFGHTLLAIYLVYAIPRLLIYPIIYRIARLFFPPIFSYLLATLPLFFPYFETYAISSLKADVFVVTLSLLALYFSLLWIRQKRQRDLFLAAIFITLNILSKETALTYSLVLAGLLGVRIATSSKQKGKDALLLSIPFLLLVVPFILFSLKTVGRPLPNLFAEAKSIASFPLNIKTYLLSPLFYSGLDFTSSRRIALTSTVRLLIILLGLFSLIKRRLWIMILPPLAVLTSLSLIETRVVQGDGVGNVEIIHRIAFIVPFMALYLGFGIDQIGIVWGERSQKLRWIGVTIILFLIASNYVNQYFSAPYSRDFVPNELYVHALTIAKNPPHIPFTDFRQKNPCVINFVPAGVFLTDYYKPYKTIAFPQYYKEILIGAWFLPLILLLLQAVKEK